MVLGKAQHSSDSAAVRPKNDPCNDQPAHANKRPKIDYSGYGFPVDTYLPKPPLPISPRPESKAIYIPSGKVGVIIGKGGETIQQLEAQSGAKIQITKDMVADPYSTTTKVELTGTPDQSASAEQLINDVLAASDYDEEDSEEDVITKELAATLWYEQARKDAADLFSSNAPNFETLNKWGAALMGLAYYNSDPAKKVKLTEEAKDKFQAAHELEPANIYNNWDLAKARLRICGYQKGNDYEDLLDSYNQLVKESEEKEESKKPKRDS